MQTLDVEYDHDRIVAIVCHRLHWGCLYRNVYCK